MAMASDPTMAEAVPKSEGGGTTMSETLASDSKKKRKREERRKEQDNELERQYRGISLESRPSSGRPGTPHRYFDGSYTAHFATALTQGCSSSQSSSSSSSSSAVASEATGQVVHRHANGLCIVTAGDVVKKTCESSDTVAITNVEFLVKASEGRSVGSKRRKKMAKSKKKNKSKKVGEEGEDCSGNDSDGFARPLDKLARIELSNGKAVEVKCCISGTILEVNTRLCDKPSLLVDDPLLDGFLAVVLPHGPVPFPQTNNTSSNNSE